MQGPAFLQDPARLMRVFTITVVILFVVPVLAPLFAGGPLEVDLLRDDAFYMFDVAHNLATGRGFTYDGIHPAGGVQVLWTLLLAVPALLLPKAALPVTAIVLGLLLLLGSGALAYRLARRYCDVDAAAVLAAFLITRPLLIAEAMNGQETLLGLFVLFVVTRRCIDALEGKPTKRGLWIWMLLLPWARSELVLVPMGLIAAYEIARWRVLIPRAKNRQVEVATAVSLVAYVAVQKLSFGAWWPVSGDAIPWLFHTNWAASFEGSPPFGETVRRYWWYVRPLVFGGPWQAMGFAFGSVLAAFALAPLSWRSRFAPLIAVVALAVFGAAELGVLFMGAFALLFATRIFHSLWRVHEGCAVLGAMLGFAAIAFLHLVVRWYPRDYYWAALAVPAVLGAAVLAGRWLGEFGLHAILPRPRRLRAFMILVFVALLFGLRLPVDRFPWQEEMRFAAREASALVGPDVGLAAFNAGLIGWEHDGPVRCLDGVVDGAALEALKERRLADWLASQEISLVVDTPRQLADRDPDRFGAHASGRFLGPLGAGELVSIVAFDLPGIGGEHPGTDCHVLARLHDAPPPELPVGPTILRRDGDEVVLFLPNERFVLRTPERERPMRFAQSAPDADWVVTRLPAEKSELVVDGRVVLRW